MKSHGRLALLLTLIFALVGCSMLNRPCIRIGATQAEIHQGIESGKAGLNLHPAKDQDPNFSVSAGFEWGVCNRIKYASVDNRKISDHAVSGILCLNSRGVAWIVQEFPVKEGKVYYRSVDSKYRAVLTNKTELSVFSEALFQKTMRENDTKNQKSKASSSLSISRKMLRFQEHLSWAKEKSHIEEAGKYLRSTPENEWSHLDEI
jgi:hypothetical protein